VLTTLNDPQLQVNRDEFPIFLFFGRIPEEDYAISVFGLPSEQTNIFKGLLLRSRDAALACPQFKEGPHTHSDN
jgi:hypothetical protein